MPKRTNPEDDQSDLFAASPETPGSAETPPPEDVEPTAVVAEGGEPPLKRLYRNWFLDFIRSILDLDSLLFSLVNMPLCY